MRLFVVLAVFSVSLSSCTEKFQRKVKDIQSDYLGGLNRTCTVYSLNGTLIKTYQGKMDIHINPNRTQFDLDGSRVIIRDATLICEEK